MDKFFNHQKPKHPSSWEKILNLGMEAQLVTLFLCVGGCVRACVCLHRGVVCKEYNIMFLYYFGGLMYISYWCYCVGNQSCTWRARKDPVCTVTYAAPPGKPALDCSHLRDQALCWEHACTFWPGEWRTAGSFFLLLFPPLYLHCSSSSFTFLFLLVYVPLPPLCLHFFSITFLLSTLSCLHSASSLFTFFFFLVYILLPFPCLHYSSFSLFMLLFLLVCIAHPHLHK